MAALWVMTAHCFIWGMGGVDRYNILEPKKAVTLFMVISGFLMIYTIDHGRTEPGRWITWKRFYVRRFFRIAPAYYLALATVILLWPPFSEGIHTLQSLRPERWANDTIYGPQFQDFSALSILLHLTFLFGLFPDYSFSTSLPDWSLSLEMQFYAVFPILYLAVRRLPFLPTSLILAGGAYVAAHV